MHIPVDIDDRSKRLRRECKPRGAETDVIVFDRPRPVLGKFVLDASADGPAPPSHVCDNRRHRDARQCEIVIFMDYGCAALGVEKSRSSRKAEPPGKQTQAIDASAVDARRKGWAWQQANIFTLQSPIALSLQANHHRASLPIEAYLSSNHSTSRIVTALIQRSRQSDGGHGADEIPATPAPSAAAIRPDVEPRP